MDNMELENEDLEKKVKFDEEVKARLDEIEEKYLGRELTQEEKIKRKQELLKVQKDAMEQFDKIWNALSRKRKRQLTKPSQTYSARLKRRLK